MESILTIFLEKLAQFLVFCNKLYQNMAMRHCGFMNDHGNTTSQAHFSSNMFALDTSLENDTETSTRHGTHANKKEDAPFQHPSWNELKRETIFSQVNAYKVRE